MANKKISQLNPVVSVTGNDVFPVVQGTETKKAKISDIKAYLPIASSVNTGLLTYTDWITFNNKQNALTIGNLTESTSSVLTISGGSSSVIGSGTTIQVKQASGSQSGFLSSTDWTTFNNKLNSLTLTTTGSSGAATLIGSTLNIPQYLGSAITSINGDTTASHTIQTDSTGTDFSISTLSGVTKIKLPTASASARGLLSSTDWSTFNGKQNALTLGNLTETTSSVLIITGGTGAVVGGTTITVKMASGTQDGYLSSSSFTAFAGKQDALTLTTTGSSGAATLVGSVLNIPQYSGGGGGGTVTSVSALTLGTTGTDLNSTVANGTTTPVITLNVPTASATNRGVLSSTDWTTFNNKQSTITLTTTGTSGASTLVGNTLNVPNYANTSADGININAAYNLLGSSMKGYTIPAPGCYISSLGAPTNGNLYFISYHIPVATTITGVKWFQSVIGSYTANNYNGVALYSYSAGTLTLVASSTNDGTIWQTGTGNLWKSKAFSSTYSASAGVYYIAFIYSNSAQVTAPTLGLAASFGTSAASPYDFTNSARIIGSIGSITALPSTQASSGLSGHTTNYAMFLY